MAFSYLNYARYGLAKLSGLSRLSKVVCETRDKFLKYPQDMIDYYNSISKVIYGSDSVTDVTDVGDKNGFRAQSVSKLGEIFKGLATYDVPFQARARGYYYPRIIQQLNIFLDGFVEAQNTMQIESCIVSTSMGTYLITFAYVPRLRYFVDVQVTFVGSNFSDTVVGLSSSSDIPDGEGFGQFSRGWVHIVSSNHDSLTLVFETFSNSNAPNSPDKMSRTVNTDAGAWYYKSIALGAEQPGFLYRATLCGDMGSGDTYIPSSSYKGEVKIQRRRFTYNPETQGSDVYSLETVDPSLFRSVLYRQPQAFEIAINDSQAMLLMHLLSNDILAEINIA